MFCFEEFFKKFSLIYNDGKPNGEKILKKYVKEPTFKGKE